MNCPRCGNENDNKNMVCSNCLKEITQNTPSQSRKEEIKKTSNNKQYESSKKNMSKIYTNMGCLTAIIFFILIIFLFKSCINSSKNSYYPKDWTDMNNKQYKEFKEWDNKKQQKKIEQKKAFGN